MNENISFLEDRLKDTKLEFNYLSSSEKLLEYQKLYFENSLIIYLNLKYIIKERNCNFELVKF